jgi:hypothetical protein
LYLAEEHTDRKCLRQGDILSALPFPIIDSELAILGRLQDAEIPQPSIRTIPREHRKKQDCFTGQIKMRMSMVAVISHCCELEIRSGKLLLPSVAVARLIPMKQSISSDSAKLASLQANKDPRIASDIGYLDYFYLEPHQVLGNVPWVVDFGQITSIASSELDSLMERKLLQLQERERVKFKYKLAGYLGRLTDEEEAKGLSNPWKPTQEEPK